MLQLLEGVASQLGQFVQRMRAEEALRVANAELERRVAARTAELEQRNGQLHAELAARVRAEAALRDSNQRLQSTLAELEATQQHMIQQERLRALGEMASGIAHDFNNALAPVIGFSELLLLRPEELEDRDKVIRYLELVHTGASDAARVVSRLREFYRPRGADEPVAEVALDAVIAQVVSLTQPRWRDQAQAQGRTIEVAVASGPLVPLLGDESALREALTNLVFNAVDAILAKPVDDGPDPTSGSQPDAITLRTHIESGTTDHADRAADAADVADGAESGEAGDGEPERREIVLEVADTGMGMPEAVRRRCLEPFYTTKGEHGTGLGLSMVHGIVQRHGGRLDVASRPGQGTTIVLRFPVRREDRGAAPTAGDGSPGRSLDVLLVDDEALVREAIATLLAADGHHVIAAGSGQEALDLLERVTADEIDVVITDRAMPGMSGDQLAAAVKRRRPAWPVILLTGFGDLMAQAGELPPDVDHVAGKPATRDSLRRALVSVATAAESRRAAPGVQEAQGEQGGTPTAAAAEVSRRERH